MNKIILGKIIKLKFSKLIVNKNQKDFYKDFYKLW